MNGYGHPADYIENGRKYCGFNRHQYLFPIDEEETNRMSIGHEIIQYARVGRPEPDGKCLHSAPIELGPRNRVPRVLDLGCGEGNWVLDMAEKFPGVEIRGVDLACIQPPSRYLPSNVRFQAPTDYEGFWTFGEQSWDLIHLALGCGSVSNWPELYKNAFRHLKPGIGYFEQVEVDFEPRCDDGTLPILDTKLNEWYGYLKKATIKANRPIAFSRETRNMLENEGFVDVEEQIIQIPLNPWPKDPHKKTLGLYYTGWMETRALESMSMQPLTLVEKKSREFVEALCREASQDIKRCRYHAYNKLHIFTARKPLEQSSS